MTIQLLQALTACKFLKELPFSDLAKILLLFYWLLMLVMICLLHYYLAAG